MEIKNQTKTAETHLKKVGWTREIPHQERMNRIKDWIGPHVKAKDNVGEDVNAGSVQEKELFL